MGMLKQNKHLFVSPHPMCILLSAVDHRRPLVKARIRQHGRAVLPALCLCPDGYPISLAQNFSDFLLLSPAPSVAPPLLLQQVLSPLTSVPRNDELSFGAITAVCVSRSSCSVCIKNTSTKSQQGVKGNSLPPQS